MEWNNNISEQSKIQKNKVKQNKKLEEETSNAEEQLEDRNIVFKMVMV